MVMISTFSKENFHSICNKLAAQDKDLDHILKTHGYPPMWTRPNTFETLVHIILEQQVSLASALAALKKLQQRTGNITPANVLQLDDASLKACYVSRQKALYIRNLAAVLSNGALDLQELEAMPDDAVRAALITLKGIGNWTIDVYLMFVLRRADVFPLGDLAAVNALKRAKQLPKETPREALPPLIAAWKPYRTIACMILWHYYLSAPVEKKIKSLI